MSAARNAQPRRKVVSSFIERQSVNTFTCTLTCGHTVAAYGMRKDGRGMPHAPKTASCWRCAVKDPANAGNPVPKNSIYRTTR